MSVVRANWRARSTLISLSSARYTEQNIRPAVLADAHGIAKVHVEAWRTAYGDTLPGAYANNLSIENREQHWTKALSNPNERMVTLVGVDGGEVVAFAAGGEERSGALLTNGELYAMY